MDYLSLLFYQFNCTKGYKKIYLDSNQYLDEFANWLYELKKQSSVYLDFALFNGVNLQDNDFIEINKGKFDTLSKEKKIISPFAYTVKQLNKKFVVYQGEPLIVSGSNIIKGQVVDTYVTHNPYSGYYFGNLDELHNNGYSICFGMFGGNSDCDKSIKLNIVKNMIRHLTDGFITQYETNDEGYYSIVFTKRLVKRKNLIR